MKNEESVMKDRDGGRRIEGERWTLKNAELKMACEG
jgi:hypothetical protein